MRQDRRTHLAPPPLDSSLEVERTALDEKTFKRVIAIERKRTERSKAPFVLMLLELSCAPNEPKGKATLDTIIDALLASCRDTDLVGWYKEGSVVGVMFTGLVVADRNAILTGILNRVSASLRDELTYEQFTEISITFHFFPDDWENEGTERPSNAALYPDLERGAARSKSGLLIKRVIDVAGSSAVLLLCSPLLFFIALAVKLTSRGPILFRQSRVGQYGKNFTFLKFRSMYVNNDSSVHQEYVRKLIESSGPEMDEGDSKNKVYKLTNDKRITPIGKFLRRTSLDELPQLFNVLRGDMSLVGPRPPIPYELAAYQTWHRRRVLEVRPGITGLWQVTGRSTVKFDEMVRLDLRYATTWTPWLDLKILLLTPLAVIKGSGAY
ncbi:MAG TPA: sugar transferase [Terracidiphilus sp.]|nr:sugar transferase [Terracidiphilus sp.]